MNGENILNNDILKDVALEIPVVYDSKNGFTAGMLSIIERYIETLRVNGFNSGIISKIENFKSLCEKMYNKYFLGYHSQSYQYFVDALDALITEDKLLISKLEETNFYRARYNDGNKDYKDNEMYHIPFNLRGKVKTQRYSFPGLPCLYLGASSYVCWLELDRPSTEMFQVALINKNDNNSDLRVIDLSMLPETVHAQLNDGKLTVPLDEYLLLWPIIALCSVIVENENDDFKPEYIFPQFMLEYVLNANDKKDYELIGIKYASIKVKQISTCQYSNKWQTYTNYVFPVRSFQVSTTNECPYLHKYFRVIKNYSGKELQILTDIVRKSGVVWEEFEGEYEYTHSSLDSALIYTSDNKFFHYKKSIFRRIEQVLEMENLDESNDEFVISPISDKEIQAIFEKGLSKEAENILREAIKDSNNIIIRTYTLQGLSLSTNNQDLATGKNPREISYLEEAFNELIENSYVISKSSKGEIYNVTPKGFEYFER